MPNENLKSIIEHLKSYKEITTKSDLAAFIKVMTEFLKKMDREDVVPVPKLTIKKEYLYLTEKLLSDCEFDMPTQETLAVVAYKNPVLQCDVIKMRGNKAYDHIKLLKDEGFVLSEKSGRTRLLKLAPKFFDYFDVVEDTIKPKDENT